MWAAGYTPPSLPGGRPQASPEADPKPPRRQTVQALQLNTEDLHLPEGVAPVLGDYRLVRFLDESTNMVMYHAVQSSVNRSVVLQLLKPEACENQKLRDEFKQLARAKANLHHQNIAIVYELLQSGRILFYTGALLSGRNLDQIATGGRELSTEQVLQIMITIGEAMVFIKENGHTHRPLKGTDIHLDDHDQAHLANLALPPGATNASRNEGVGLQKFITSLDRVAPQGIAKELLTSLRKSFTNHEFTWDDLLGESRAARRRYNISRANNLRDARLRASTWLREKKRRRFGAAALLLGAVGALVALLLTLPETEVKARAFDTMVPVAAGTIGSRPVERFWIDEHEVTIGQYAAFLDDIGDSTRFDHADQPATRRGHVPEGWELLLEQARVGGSYRGHPIDLDCPVALVDWWDAHAYARWIGRRLPTSDEWVLAATGGRPVRYPWGDDPPGARANLGADYQPEGGEAGQIDGYNLWAPVDGHPEDRSGCGAVGLAGNVEEWTATWSNHPDYPDRQTPVVHGGSFASSDGQPVVEGRRAASPEDGTLARGFRTATSVPPVE